jgi:hypothetical protein
LIFPGANATPPVGLLAIGVKKEMSSQSLPKQPDAEAPESGGTHPSLLLYAALILMSIGMIAVGFSLQQTPDWAGLLLNLAAGFIGSVVVLIFVDRRLRANEIHALTRLPAAGGLRFRATLFPSHRVAFRYSRSLLMALEPNLKHTIRLPGFEELEKAARDGFVLRGAPGTGKTTWTQLCASDLAHRFLSAEEGGRVAILLPLARWLPDRSLYRALFERVYSIAPCSEWCFKKFLRSGLVVVILDGYDELWNRQLPLDSEHQTMKAQYPEVSWVLTSRSAYPVPSTFGEVRDMPMASDDMLAAIRERGKMKGT